MANFTAGPWIVTRWETICGRVIAPLAHAARPLGASENPDSCRANYMASIAHVGGHECHFDAHEAAANAHMIAAAPDLYAAATAMMTALRHCRDSAPAEWDALSRMAAFGELMRAWDANKAALAKAEGREA